MHILEHLFLVGEFPRGPTCCPDSRSNRSRSAQPARRTRSTRSCGMRSGTIQRCVVEQDKELEAVLRGGTRGTRARCRTTSSSGTTSCSSSWSGRGGSCRVGAGAEPTRGRGGARIDDGRGAQLSGGAQRVSPRQDRRAAAEDRRLAAEGSDRGVVAARARWDAAQLAVAAAAAHPLCSVPSSAVARSPVNLGVMLLSLNKG